MLLRLDVSQVSLVVDGGKAHTKDTSEVSPAPRRSEGNMFDIQGQRRFLNLTRTPESGAREAFKSGRPSGVLHLWGSSGVDY